MRIDNFLVINKYFDSRTKAQQAISRGEVFVNGTKVAKPSFSVLDDCQIIIKSPLAFVSLGGYKMHKALTTFNFDVKDMVVADVGASTGGFSDCLLQNGAKKIYAIDINDQLLHDKIRNNERVYPIIKNARDLTGSDFDEKIDLIVADLSFISATYVLPAFSNILDNDKHLILLIKPQFETGIKKHSKNGIIRDEKLRKSACDNVINCADKNGFIPLKITTAPNAEDKNVEYLLLLQKSQSKNVKIQEFF